MEAGEGVVEWWVGIEEARITSRFYIERTALRLAFLLSKANASADGSALRHAARRPTRSKSGRGSLAISQSPSPAPEIRNGSFFVWQIAWLDRTNISFLRTRLPETMRSFSSRQAKWLLAFCKWLSSGFPLEDWRTRHKLPRCHVIKAIH